MPVSCRVSQWLVGPWVVLSYRCRPPRVIELLYRPSLTARVGTRSIDTTSPFACRNPQPPDIYDSGTEHCGWSDGRLGWYCSDGNGRVNRSLAKTDSGTGVERKLCNRKHEMTKSIINKCLWKPVLFALILRVFSVVFSCDEFILTLPSLTFAYCGRICTATHAGQVRNCILPAC